MRKNLIVFIDSDNTIVEDCSANNTDDTVFAIARELTKQYGEPITPHYAMIIVGEEYTDRHPTAIKPIKQEPLDICHKHGLCGSGNFVENEIDVLSRCPICPRRDK